MAKHLRNRTAKEWEALLKGLGFTWSNSDGDDMVFKHPDCNIAVLVPMRNETIILPTSDSMARKTCQCLIIKKKDLFKWWKDNGFGE